MGSAVRVEVLGPLRLLVDGQAVPVRGQKRRAALALLALAEGRVVAVDGLVNALWPDAVPESGRAALHSQLSRLRAQFGSAADRLETRTEGYRLALDADQLDLSQARSLLDSARRRQARDPAAALADLREAHALWRGPVLADVDGVASVAAAVRGLAELRREVVDSLVDCALVAGAAEQVASLAVSAVAEDPLRETAVLLCMRVLAATGRAAEALQAGREFRERLAQEAGLDPSPALDELVRDIATSQAPPTTVRPAPATRLHGRDAELTALTRLLAAQRLLTLVGPGGVGKTRVALELAHRRGAATVVRLAPVTEPSALPHALAEALRLTVVQGDVLASCLAVLADGSGLVVIDNCEHLLDAVRELVAAILASCPGVVVLATSREPLGLATEYVHRLPPLDVPQAGGDPRAAPSVAVFLDRAGRVRPGAVMTAADIETIADIVRRLDGMPLAIELAAGRLSSLSVKDLHRRLDRSLDLLGGRPSGEARHATLRETIAWSYRLLAPAEQRLFRHLAVFADGLDLADAERLATGLGLRSDPGGLLSRLVDASMIEPDFTAGTRYRMLETLRAFALDRLEAEGETRAAEDHLLRWAVDRTAWIAATFATEREPEADAVLRRELPNLRAAWRLARDRTGIDICIAMTAPLFDAVAFRDLLEIREWAQELAGDAAVTGHPDAAFVLGNAAEVAYHRGEYDRAERLARAGMAAAGGGAGGTAWYCLTVLSVVALARGAYDEVVRLALAAHELCPAARDGLGIAALATAYKGDPAGARELNAQGRASAVSPSMRAWGSYVEGEIDNVAGDAERAERHYLTAVELARSSGASFLVGVATVGLLTVRARGGRVHDALRGYREVIGYFARTGNWTHLWTTLRNLADLLRRLGDTETAALLDTAADRAPDAPAAPASLHTLPGPVPGRAAVLDAARQAIERHLATKR